MWSKLTEHVEARGRGAKAAWLRRFNELAKQHGLAPQPVATFYDRLNKGRRVDWDESSLMISAAGLDPADWKPAWERADEQRRTNRSAPKGSRQPVASGAAEAPPPSAAEAGSPPEPPRRRHPAFALALPAATTLAAGVVVAAIVALTSGAADSQAVDRPPATAPTAVSPAPLALPPSPPQSSPTPSASLPPSTVPPSSSPAASGSRPAARTVVPEPRSAPLPTTGTRSSSATSARRVGHADFHRNRGQFVLFDDKKDDQGVLLELRVDGVDYEPVRNARGKTETGNPAKLVTLSDIDANSVVEFRVCISDNNAIPLAESCGAWTRDTG